MQTASAFFSRPLDQLTVREEARFFTGLKTGNATFKTTNGGRFHGVDEAIVAELAVCDQHVRHALDIGISSGITTLELTGTLRAAGHPAHMTGTDRMLSALIVDLPWGCRALVEPDGHVLQYELLGMAIRPWRRRLDFFTGLALPLALVNRCLAGRAATEARRQHERQPAADTVRLVSRRLAQVPDVALIEDDILRRNPKLEGRFDFIRAANILNRDYFSPDDLAQACGNLRSYLAGPGAMLLLIRSIGETAQDGTLFRLSAQGQLDVVRRFGRGSEVEMIALGA